MNVRWKGCFGISSGLIFDAISSKISPKSRVTWIDHYKKVLGFDLRNLLHTRKIFFSSTDTPNKFTVRHIFLNAFLGRCCYCVVTTKRVAKMGVNISYFFFFLKNGENIVYKFLGSTKENVRVTFSL